jgi:hypothetical protein
LRGEVSIDAQESTSIRHIVARSHTVRQSLWSRYGWASNESRITRRWHRSLRTGVLAVWRAHRTRADVAGFTVDTASNGDVQPRGQAAESRSRSATLTNR